MLSHRSYSKTKIHASISLYTYIHESECSYRIAHLSLAHLESSSYQRLIRLGFFLTGSAKLDFACVILTQGKPVGQERKPVHQSMFLTPYSVRHVIINTQLAKVTWHGTQMKRQALRIAKIN